MNTLFAGNQNIQDIVDNYSDLLLRIAFQNLKNLSDAQDIVQEVYIKLMKSDVNFHSEEHLKAWLIRVTINKCKDFFKSSWFKKTTSLSQTMELFAPDEQEVMEEIFQLDKKYRNVIYLYYYEGYKINEIASMLSKSPNTVSSWLQRARNKLKFILEEDSI